MKQIKVFKSINQNTINKFLKDTRGVIVSYNPIIVEYEVFDNKVLPTVTHRGYSFTAQAKADSSLYDWGANLEQMNAVKCNEVLFFANKIVFLADQKEQFYIKCEDTWRETLYTAFKKGSDKPIYVDYFLLNGASVNISSLQESLNEIGAPAVENFIAYNERTKAYEYVGKLKSEATIKSVKLIKDGLDSVAGSLNYIANTNRKIHNGRVKRKII